jgi:O-antigen ligase
VSLFLSILGVYQGMAPWGCHQLQYAHGEKIYMYDGRDCDPENREVCSAENAEPGADYACERVGLFGTNSDHGRVRYRGTLADPNELSLVIGIAVPFAFAFVDRKRTLARQTLLFVTLGLVGACAVFTQSRGGQLVFLAVLGVYFLNRFGMKGLVLGVALALPIMLLGGREGAESSTIERTECWYEGMLMFWHQPLFGVGYAQFTEHHFLTAHNSYVLAPAELGFPGMWLWSAVLYLSIKIPVMVLRTPGLTAPPVARSWSLAFIASMVGLCVGILFLSYCYKEFLWIYVGLSAALYQAVRRHAPGFVVKLTAKDALAILAVDVMLILFISGYTRWKVG